MPEVIDPEQIKRLQAIVGAAALHSRHAPKRYDDGHVFDLAIKGVSPATTGRAKLVVEKFVGGGFAGQVYRSRLTELELDGEPIAGLEVGGRYAVKIMIPASAGKRLFRNALYWLGYQGSFSAQVNEDAARTGALWQKLIRRGAAIRFGDENAVRDIHATFFDAALGSFGEINAWVEGRNWKFEIDDRIFGRGKQPPGEATHSQEYLAKKKFMADLVRLFHDMGAPELARQYEWWSAKSQPNVMKRFDAGDGVSRGSTPRETLEFAGGKLATPAEGGRDGPADGLTALDFRAGLALLAFLPMSPVDVRLCLRGIRQGKLVQFDRGDLDKLEAFCDEHAGEFADLAPALEELKRVDPAYRASLPGNHSLTRLLFDGNARRSVRAGLVQGWKVRRLIDEEHAEKLVRSTFAFPMFFLAGFLPLVGKHPRRLWGHAGWRRHAVAFFTSFSYTRRAVRAARAEILTDWYRDGRVGTEWLEFFLRDPFAFWTARVLPGLLPLPPKWHRFLAEWRYAWESLKDAVTYPVRFYRDAAFRVEWLTEEIEDGAKRGMLTSEEKQHVLDRVPDPFIQKYLKCVAVHVCTLPITQVISVVVAAYAAIRFGQTWAEAWVYALGTLAAFQFLPVSPGSFVRGTYVLYLMIRERNWRNYWLALIVSYWHYIGYLGFPLQMVKEFPTLSRFMAGRWATKITSIIPVFGESGALLEHWVFDLFFNVPLTVKRRFEEMKSRSWHYGHVAAALLIAFIVQGLVLPCLCELGVAKMTLAIAVDVLILFRVAVARITDEKGRGWLFYCGLLYASPLWIEIVSRLVIGAH